MTIDIISVFSKSASGSMSRKIWFALSRGKELSHLGEERSLRSVVFFSGQRFKHKKDERKGMHQKCSKMHQKATENWKHQVFFHKFPSNKAPPAGEKLCEKGTST